MRVNKDSTNELVERDLEYVILTEHLARFTEDLLDAGWFSVLDATSTLKGGTTDDQPESTDLKGS